MPSSSPPPPQNPKMPSPTPANSPATLRRRLLLLHLFLSASLHLAEAHRSSSSFSSPALSDWNPARASYYAASDPRDTIGGACGYGDLGKSGYGLATAGLSSALFEKGLSCGGCYEVRCVEEHRYCIPGTSIVVTATNFCAPNYGLPSDAGGLCNPPNSHFVMPIAAFEKIAIWKAGVLPIQYRRIKCIREGGVRFTVEGRRFFVSVLVSNVAGAGDVAAVKVKGTATGWLQMGRNWGQNWHIGADLRGQPLSFELTTGNGASLISYNVAPHDWSFGQTYVGKQFPF